MAGLNVILLEQWHKCRDERIAYEALPIEDQIPDELVMLQENELSANECFLNRNRKPGDDWITAP